MPPCSGLVAASTRKLGAGGRPMAGVGYADLCKLPVLLLLPNGRFSGFLYCTGFVGYLEGQRYPNNGHYGCRKVGFSTIARLMVFRHHF